MTTTIEVPDAIADEVRRFAAFVLSDRRDTETQLTAPRADSEPDHIADYPLWQDNQVIGLANGDTITAGNYRAIMDAVIARKRVGEWVSLDDLSEWTSIQRSVLSTFRTHLYRYVNSHLGTGHLAPFTREWGENLRPARGREVFYRVSQECAAQWERVRPQLKERS